MLRCTLACLLLVLGVPHASALAGHDWPQWRGPALNGSSEAANLPDSLDVNKNLAWQTRLPGVGSATPVCVEDRVFVSCWDDQSKKLLGVCVSRSNGHILWQKEIGIGAMQNDRNNPASPSPATDGKRVYFYYASGDLAAFDLDGNPLWERNIQKDYGAFHMNWIYGSSPLLYKGKLYVQVLHRDVPARGPRGGDGTHADSYLLALDPATGKELWKVTRPNDAMAESKEAYSTPVPLEFGGRSEIIVVGGDCVTAHDAQTGKELWRAGGWNVNKREDFRLVPSATVDPVNGLVFACAPKNGPVMAIRDGGSGDVTEGGFAWKTREYTSDVCVPLLYKGNLYVLDGDKKMLICVDPKTGAKKWSGALGGGAPFRASPTGADNKIYCMNQNGDAWVLSADEFKVLSKQSFGGKLVNSTIIASDGLVILRLPDTLFGFRN